MNTKPNEELREQIYAKLKSDKRADTYVIPTRVMDVVVDFIQTEIAEAERRARESERNISDQELEKIWLDVKDYDGWSGEFVKGYESALRDALLNSKDRIKQLTEIEVSGEGENNEVV